MTEAGGAEQQVDERLGRDGGLSAVALQNARPSGLGHHLPGVVGTDGQDPEADVIQEFGEDAPQPEHDDRAELIVPLEADDDLKPSGDRLLDLYPLHACLGCPLVGRSDYAPVGGTYGFLGIEPQFDSTDVGLVKDVRRHDLEGHRIAYVSGEGRGLVRVAGEAASRHDEAVVGERGHTHNVRRDHGLSHGFLPVSTREAQVYRPEGLKRDIN